MAHGERVCKGVINISVSVFWVIAIGLSIPSCCFTKF